MTTTNVNLSKSSNYRFENGKLQRHVNAGWFDQDFTRCVRNVGKFKIYADHFDCNLPYSNYYVADTETGEVYVQLDYVTYANGGLLSSLVEHVEQYGVGEAPEPQADPDAFDPLAWMDEEPEKEEEEMERNLYQRSELEAFVGSENLDDFDLDAIEDEATEIDYRTGNRYWREGIDLDAICAAHDLGGQAGKGATYAFESANAGTVEVSVSGRYRDGGADVDASFVGGDRSFEECVDADEVIQWLVDCGVEFASDRSMAFSREYVQCALIDGERTEAQLLDAAAGWTDADVEWILSGIRR